MAITILEELHMLKKPDSLSLQAVIFDMDGVIFDTEHLAMRLWIQAADELGISGIAEVYPSVIGTNTTRTHEILAERYDASFPWEDFDSRIRTLYHEHYEREGLPVKPGVPELLSSLAANHVPLALASSTHSDLVRRELRDAGFLDYFDVVIGGDMVTHSKPHPEIFLRAAEALHAAPENCYVIEDSFNGIRAAAAAGAHPLMVPDLLQPTEEIRVLSEQVFPSLYELRSFLLPSGALRA